MRFTPKRNYIKTIDFPAPEGYYTVMECAKYFHVTVECVYRWIRNKKVKGVYRFRGIQAYFVPKSAIPEFATLQDRRTRKYRDSLNTSLSTQA